MAQKYGDQLKVFRTLNELNPEPYPYLCLSGKKSFYHNTNGYCFQKYPRRDVMFTYAPVDCKSRPTGFIKDTSYVALDVDMWCPDVVVVVVVRACVCVGGGGALVGGGGGGGCLCKSRHI